MGNEIENPIVFFDGVCNLCNGFVDFLISRDRRGRLRYASLQGETALRRLGPKPGRELASILFLKADGSLERESDAALSIASHLGGPWRMTCLLRIIPRPVRDSVYRWVARNRYRWFGRRETCRLPTAEEKRLFLP